MFGEYRIGPKRVLATVTMPKNMSGKLLTPVKALIHIPSNQKVPNGSIFFEGRKPLYILVFHHQIHGTQIYTGIEINTQVDVQLSVSNKNSVTKMQENRVLSGPIQKVYACEELVTSVEVAGLNAPEKVYYLPQEVTSDHFINGVRVRNAIRVSGVYRVEVG